MRHHLKRDKLARTSSHRRAMLANMVASLIEHEQIKTTLPKAKLLSPFAQKLVTLAKGGNLAQRRLALQRVRDERAVGKLFDTLAKRYQSRRGGYTRIIRCGYRAGDNAPMAFIEFVDRDKLARAAADKARQAESQQIQTG